METPTNSVDACSKKSKKPLIAGIVVAVVVLAGIGFLDMAQHAGFLRRVPHAHEHVRCNVRSAT